VDLPVPASSRPFRLFILCCGTSFTGPIIKEVHMRRWRLFLGVLLCLALFRLADARTIINCYGTTITVMTPQFCVRCHQTTCCVFTDEDGTSCWSSQDWCEDCGWDREF
jgi:hypothetical protein